MQAGRRVHASCCHREGWTCAANAPGGDRHKAPRCTLVANAGGRPFCRELDIGWVHIGQWIFSISALSHELFWRKCVCEGQNLTGLKISTVLYVPSLYPARG